jgi:hypothetical protein
MAAELGQAFAERIDAAHQRLASISEREASQPYRPGGWLRKEMLGHLLDSAANNHQRFVRAALDGHYSGPSYAQEDWVRLHGYKELPWAGLVASWRERNATLSRIVFRIDDSALDAMCTIGEHEPVTLRFVIEDYLAHMERHIDQMTGAR